MSEKTLSPEAQANLDALDAVIAAAEERGRRSGVEERDELREALCDLFGAVQNPDLYIEGVSTVTRPLRIAIAKARAALAPRDSALEPLARAVADEQGVNFDDDQPRDPAPVCGCGRQGGHSPYCAKMQPRDSGKEGQR